MLRFVNRCSRAFSANKLRDKRLYPLLDAIGIPRGEVSFLASWCLDQRSELMLLTADGRNGELHCTDLEVPISIGVYNCDTTLLTTVEAEYAEFRKAYNLVSNEWVNRI